MRDITRVLTLDDELSTPSGKRLAGKISLGPDFRIQRDEIDPYAIRNAFRAGGAHREIAALLKVSAHLTFEVRAEPILTTHRMILMSAHRTVPNASQPSAIPQMNAAAV